MGLGFVMLRLGSGLRRGLWKMGGLLSGLLAGI